MKMQQLEPAALSQIYDCLRATQNQQAETRQAAEAALRNFETKPGFCACLAVRDFLK